MTPAAPPAAWCITLLLITPLLYGFGEQAMAASRFGSWSAEPAVAARIAEFFARPRDPKVRRGVMLGMSGGWCTFEDAPAGEPLEILPIAALGQGLHELYPYIDLVLAHRPDVILVQGTALVTAAVAPSPYRVVRRRLRERYLWPLLGRSDDYKDGVVAGSTARDICPGLARPLETWTREMTEDIEWVTRDRGEPARQRVQGVLAALIDSAVPIVVFDQPHNAYSVPYFRVVDARLEPVLASLGRRRRRLTVLRYPDLWPTSLFFEAVHLRPPGARKFRRRLLGDIATLLAPREGAR
jgi:hypothetical protein